MSLQPQDNAITEFLSEILPGVTIASRSRVITITSDAIGKSAHDATIN